MKVIAQAAGKTNAADTSTGLAPYQYLGTTTQDIPLTVSVRKLQPGVLMPELIRSQCRLLGRAPSDTKPGQGTLEQGLDWPLPPGRIGYFLPESEKYPSQLKWPPLILLESGPRRSVYDHSAQKSVLKGIDWN